MKTEQHTEIKRNPKPEYAFCNSGHQLTEVYSERFNRYVWDCPTCIEKQKEAIAPERCSDSGELSCSECGFHMKGTCPKTSEDKDDLMAFLDWVENERTDISDKEAYELRELIEKYKES